MARAQVFSDWLYQIGRRMTGDTDRADTASEVRDRFKTRIGM